MISFANLLTRKRKISVLKFPAPAYLFCLFNRSVKYCFSLF